MASKVKRGFMSAHEKGYIAKHEGRRTVEEIAIELNRDPEQVAKYVGELKGGATPPPAPSVARSAPRPTLKNDLKGRPEWKNFEKQFDAEELRYFEYKFIQYMNQFGEGDIRRTEEKQIFDLIAAEIVSNQIAAERKILSDRQKDIAAEIELRRKNRDGKRPSKPELNAESELHDDFKSLSKAIGDADGRLEMTQKRQDMILKGLKATREQRVKLHVDSGRTLLDLLKSLDDEAFREEVGVESETMRIAMEKQQQRFTEEIQYDDGSFDTPLLLPETASSDAAPED